MEIIADDAVRRCVDSPGYYMSYYTTTIALSPGPLTSSLSTIKCDIIDTDQ